MTVPKGHCAYARSDTRRPHWPKQECQRQCEYCQRHWPIPGKPHIRLKGFWHCPGNPR